VEKLKGAHIIQEYEYIHGLLLLIDTFHGMSKQELNEGPIARSAVEIKVRRCQEDI